MPDDPSRFRQGQWQPAYPEFAVPAEGPLGDRLDDTGVEEWVTAPASSNVLAFRFWDSRKHKFIRTLFGGRSQLQVRFKPSGNNGVKEYTYHLADAETGKKIFEDMAASPHPWSEVGYPRLVEAKIPYERTV